MLKERHGLMQNLKEDFHRMRPCNTLLSKMHLGCVKWTSTVRNPDPVILTPLNQTKLEEEDRLATTLKGRHSEIFQVLEASSVRHTVTHSRAHVF